MRSGFAAAGLRSEDTGPVAAAPDGGLWLAVGTNAIARFDGTNFAYLTPRDGLPHGVVTALHAAPSGELWVGLFTAGASYNEGGYVARFDGKSFTVFSRHDEAMGTQSGYPAGMCFDIQTGPGGGTWFGGINGIGRYDPSGFRSYTEVDGLRPGTIHTLMVDPEARCGWTTPTG